MKACSGRACMGICEGPLCCATAASLYGLTVLLSFICGSRCTAELCTAGPFCFKTAMQPETLSDSFDTVSPSEPLRTRHHGAGC